MSHKLTVGLLSIVCAFAFAPVGNGGEKVVKSSDTLVFMGDSITEFGVSRSHGYVNLVVKGLAANGITPTWYGVGVQGNTAAQMLARFDKDVIARNPTVVTISAGVNDTYQNRTYAAFEKDELAMIAKVKAAGAKCMLLSPTTQGYSPEDTVTDLLHQFVGGIKQMAVDQGVAYARTHELYQHRAQDADSPVLFDGRKATCDNVHMSPASDRQMARATLIGFGLDLDELSVAEAEWNIDDTLVPLVSYDADQSPSYGVSLTSSEMQTLTGLTLKTVLQRGIPSLAANPSVEAEADGANQSLTISRSSAHIGYQAYDQLIIAARKLGISVEQAVRCAVLRGIRDTSTPAAGAPVVRAATVHPGSTTATIEATIESVGATASSCDVFLKLDSGAPRRIVVGESATFDCLIEGLRPNTTYAYELTFKNNATTSKSVTERGSFRTLAEGPIQPSGDDDTATLQAAIAAAAPNGTVTLAGGVFNLCAELTLDNGVKLVGQGMVETILRQYASHRVMTVKGGSTVCDLTLEGGKTTSNWEHGAGVDLVDGTVSYCRVRRNHAGWRNGSNLYGGGIHVEKGVIEHSVICDNEVSGAISAGGGIGWRYSGGPVVIGSCLIFDNVAANGEGGGICIVRQGPTNPQITISNTTIAGNTAKSGAGVSIDSSATGVGLVNSIVSGNTGTETVGNVSGAFAEEANSVTDDSVVFVDPVSGDYRVVSGASGIGYNEFAEASVAKPAFSPAGEVFYSSVDVTVICATAGATIRYTLDGSDPSEESPVYSGALTLTATTTVKARAFKTDMDPSPVVSAVYTYQQLETPVAPTLGMVTVTPAATKAAVSGSISSLGNNGATSCDVYISLNGASATRLGTGVAGAFNYTVTGLAPGTQYAYTLTVSNNAATVMGAETSSSFTTTAKPAAVEPGATPAETRQAIQSAIDAAAAESPAGAVTLGEGEFELDAELAVAGGVKLVGQGWERTTLKQTVSGKRVVTVGEASRLEGVTVTGGKITDSWTQGAGVLVDGGTVSFCRITGNGSTATGAGGVGIGLKKGSVDHCVIDNNKSTGSSTVGGGVGVDAPTGPVLVDTCLIYGNFAKNGGGIGAGFKNNHQLLTVRNTTIANNAAESGCALYEEQNLSGTKYDLKLENCVIADNQSGSVTGIAFYSYSGEANAAKARAGCEAQSYGNVLANGETFGEKSKTVAGGGAGWFVDAANGDYHLAAGSAPIGAGTTYDGIGNDLDGRLFATTPSAGCYEFVGAVIERKGAIFAIW